MIEPVISHDDAAVLRTRPLGTRAVDVHLDAVPFRIGEVDRLADEVVGRAREMDFALRRVGEPGAQMAPAREQEGCVEEARPLWAPGLCGGIVRSSSRTVAPTPRRTVSEFREMVVRPSVSR